MPNFAHLAVNAFYHLGLALWIGGAIALGALAAPELFRQLPRPQAGAIFGPTLRRFSRVRLGAMVAVIAAAATKHFLWETHAATIWMALRWAAIAALTALVVYEIWSLEPAMERARGTDRFGRLHKRAEGLMKGGVMVALVALFLS